MYANLFRFDLGNGHISNITSKQPLLVGQNYTIEVQR